MNAHDSWSFKIHETKWTVLKEKIASSQLWLKVSIFLVINKIIDQKKKISNDTEERHVSNKAFVSRKE